MVEEKPAPKIEFIGNTEEEKIANAQMFQIGMGILQRFGSQFTPDEKFFMNVAFSMFVKPAEEEGAKRSGRAVPRQQTEGEEPSQQVPPAHQGVKRQLMR